MQSPRRGLVVHQHLPVVRCVAEALAEAEVSVVENRQIIHRRDRRVRGVEYTITESDDKVKSSRYKARKYEGMRRTYWYAAMTKYAAQRSRWTFYEVVRINF